MRYRHDAVRSVLCLALMLSLSACGLSRAAPHTTAAIAWSATDSAAHARPKVVFIHAAWSMASVEMDQHVFTDPSVVAEAARFDAVRLDISDGLGTAAHAAAAPYHATGAPTVVLVGADGREATRFGRLVDAPSLVEAMRSTH